MSNAADRKNNLVIEQIELGSYKQALQLCNRRIKKGEKSEQLLALKAFVLTHLETPAANEEAAQIARTLSDQTPPTLSTEVLRLLSQVWTKLPDGKEEVTKLWERAVKAQPQNEDLAREWFWGTVRAMDWRNAQKAAMNLQKTYTKRREYWFWAVISCLLLHNSLPEDSPERKLFGTLAYRMADKARADTPADTTIIPPRAIQTSQEVNLLLELLPYVAPGDADKAALDILNSKNLGVDSTIGTGDWWGLARRRLDLFESTKDWRSLFDTCLALLPKPEEANGDGEKKDEKPVAVEGRGDDWRVWDGFVTAAGKLYDDGDKDIAKQSLEKIIEHRNNLAKDSSRNGVLALVKFASLFHDKNDGPEGTPTLLEACQEYFVNTGVKTCCFEDIQTYLEMLEESERKDFLKYVEGKVKEMPEEDEKQKINKVASTINWQKFVYLLMISPISASSPAAIKTITTFTTINLKHYVSALPLGSALLVTDNQYGDDAALLSVMGLVRLYTLDPTSQAPLYQSIAILATLLKKSRHNYQALLILLRLYLLLGAIGQALTVYPRLSIKQIQNDTLSHFLLTRISTLLPQDARTPTLLHEAAGIYESSRTQTPNMLQLAFEKGGYAQMLGFLEFAERVDGSLCRSMFEIELARLARLNPGYPYEAAVGEIGFKGRVWDNRDFAVVADCELTAVGPFEKQFRLGPTPAEAWVRAGAAAEEVVAFMAGERATLGDDGAGRIAKALKTGEAEFTAAEKAHLMLVGAVAEAVKAANAKDGETVAKAVEGIVSYLLPTVVDGDNDWSILHALWTAKDSAAVTELLATFLEKAKGVKPKPDVKALKEGISRVRGLVQQRAAETRKALEDEDTVQGLVDEVLREDGVGGLFRKESVFGGVEGVADGVKEVRESVVEAFQGL